MYHVTWKGSKFLHSDKDHQMPFVGGLNVRITNPRWRTTTILEKSKNRHISATVLPVATKFGTVTQVDHLTVASVKFQTGSRNKAVSHMRIEQEYCRS